MFNDVTVGLARVNCQRGGDVHCLKLFGIFNFVAKVTLQFTENAAYSFSHPE